MRPFAVLPGRHQLREKPGTMVELIAVFAVGVVAGLAVAWGYVLSLKDTIRVCRSYIHDRLDQQALVLQDSRWCKGGSLKDKHYAFSAPTQPEPRREQRA